jgi:hypothetical protein
MPVLLLLLVVVMMMSSVLIMAGINHCGCRLKRAKRFGVRVEE